MDHPKIIAAMAKAAAECGAAAVRVEGVGNIDAVRPVVKCPIIGIVKIDLDDSPVRITPFKQNIIDLVAAGSDIVAVDATDRPRPETVAAAIDLTRSLGALFMADCATVADGINAQELGADILGTTMSGYTTDVVPGLPDLKLVADLAALDAFVIAEGRYHTPALATEAIKSGADAVVVGSAITRLEVVTGWFYDAIKATEVSR